jgi:ribose/xylose/arabinose/galactoside ABC-type transport system permease subunit
MSQPKATAAGGNKFKGLYTLLGLVVFILLMVVAMAIVSPVFLSPGNIINILRQVSLNGILAVGLTFVILTGGIDLSVGSLVAVTGVVVGSMLLEGASWYAAALTGILVSVLFGVFNGVMIAHCSLPPFIATLAGQTIGRGFALVFSDGKPFAVTNKDFLNIGKGDFLGIPIPIWILFVVCVVAGIVLNYTTYGRHVYAFGGNRNATKLSGVKTKFVEMMVYIISALMAGIVGVILAARISSGQPTAGSGYELDAIAAVAIGGTSMSGGIGTLSGTILGFIIIGVLSNSLTLLNVSSFYQQIVKGAIILIAVLMDMRSKRKE